MAKGRVILDADRCKGCSLCTLACPKDLLAMATDRLNARGYHPVLFADPQKLCTGCGLCAVICPEVCLAVYRIARTPARAHPVADVRAFV